MRLRNWLLGLSLIAATAAPLAAQDDAETLERRLRACLAGGAPGAPSTDLLAAVVALRSLCYTQINRVEEVRLRQVDESFGLPEKRLNASDQERR